MDTLATSTLHRWLDRHRSKPSLPVQTSDEEGCGDSPDQTGNSTDNQPDEDDGQKPATTKSSSNSEIAMIALFAPLMLIAVGAMAFTMGKIIYYGSTLPEVRSTAKVLQQGERSVQAYSTNYKTSTLSREALQEQKVQGPCSDTCEGLRGNELRYAAARSERGKRFLRKAGFDLSMLDLTDEHVVLALPDKTGRFSDKDFTFLNRALTGNAYKNTGVKPIENLDDATVNHSDEWLVALYKS